MNFHKKKINEWLGGLYSKSIGFLLIFCKKKQKHIVLWFLDVQNKDNDSNENKNNQHKLLVIFCKKKKNIMIFGRSK